MKLRIGTRGSRLALAQAREVADALTASGIETELVTITTAGDRGADPASDPAGVKGLFVTEIVRALLDEEIDLAVHSAKDLPAGDDEGVVIAAVPERSSALDVLVTRDGDLPPGARGRDLEHPPSGAGVPLAAGRAGEAISEATSTRGCASSTRARPTP